MGTATTQEGSVVVDYDRSTALVVVDMQNDFADPKGSLYVRGGERVVPLVNREIERALAAGALVVYTQDWHPAQTPHFQSSGGVWPEHGVQGTWGAELQPDLQVAGVANRARREAASSSLTATRTMRRASTCATSGEGRRSARAPIRPESLLPGGAVKAHARRSGGRHRGPGRRRDRRRASHDVRHGRPRPPPVGSRGLDPRARDRGGTRRAGARRLPAGPPGAVRPPGMGARRL
ncbi:MAG TPA: isochorismatase family protein [Actinomycetes bacterium]|nr:isochorismatase family protein [Actinomycetes bacterium]